MQTELRILFVEDDPNDAELALGLLEEAGYRCQWERVTSREMLEERLEASTYDIVLCDLSMPGFSGLGALQLFRQRGLDIPFVFLSGTMGEEVAIDSIKAGATDYVLKVHMSRLVPVVTRALQEREAERQRKRAEEALRRSEERFRSLIENAMDIIVVLSPSGAIRYVSPSVERGLGYMPEALGGQSLFDFVHPEDLRRVRDSFERTLQSRGGTAQEEFRFRHQDGSWRVLEAMSRNLLDDPNVAGAVINARDITEREQLKQQLLHAQKMETVGRLAGGLAHDFNNLLTGILGYAELLQQEVPEVDRGAYLGQIVRAGERGAEMIRQLLAFARKQVIEPKVVRLDDLVVGMSQMLRRLLGEDIELVVRTPPDLWSVKVDPTQFEQVIVNLAVNSRDAMPSGGMLTVEAVNCPAGPELVQIAPGAGSEPAVMVAVSDTGVGMDEATMSRLFEPFFTTKHLGKGTGLGLATCYGIVRQARGHIRVESAPGKGSTFRIYPPRAEGGAKAQAGVAAAGPLSKGRETILLVEDDAMVRDLASRILHSEGYTVLVVGDGSEALGVARSHVQPIDLLLTDVVMPQMGGEELAETLRREKHGLRVLYTSGYTSEAFLERKIPEQGIAFLQKPYRFHTLVRKVREVLDR
jgi:PAS domain S-box-containing protein